MPCWLLNSQRITLHLFSLLSLFSCIVSSADLQRWLVNYTCNSMVTWYLGLFSNGFLPSMITLVFNDHPGSVPVTTHANCWITCVNACEMVIHAPLTKTFFWVIDIKSLLMLGYASLWWPFTFDLHHIYIYILVDQIDVTIWMTSCGPCHAHAWLE